MARRSYILFTIRDTMKHNTFIYLNERDINENSVTEQRASLYFAVCEEA